MVSNRFFALILLVVGVGVAGVGCSERAKLDRRIEAAEKALAAGDASKAEQEYWRGLAINHSDPQLLGRLGMFYYQQGHILRSFTLLEKALKALPNDPDIGVTYALACMSLKRNQDARVAAKKVLEVRPRDDVAVVVLADTCITTRDSAEAKRIVEELRQKHGDTVGYHIATGMLLRGQKELATAETEFRKALALDPKSSTAHDQLSSVLDALKRPEPAAEHLKIASELAPARSPVRVKYITHLIRTDARDKAKELITATLAQAPEAVPVLLVSMQLAFAERRFEDSSKLAVQVLSHDAANYTALMQLATIKLAEGDFAGSIAKLKELERHYARVADVKYNLAQVYVRSGDLYGAEETLKKALADSPNHESGLLLLAEVQLRKGNPADAIPPLQRLLKRKPQLRRGQVLLAQAHRAKGEHAEGLAILRALAAADPKNPDNQHLIGLALTGRDPAGARKAFEAAVEISDTHWASQDLLVEYDLAGRKLDEATRRVETLIEKHPAAAMPWLLRGRIRSQAGDLAGAEADFRKVVELEPDAYRAYLGLARIYRETKKEKEAVEALTASASRSNNAGVYMQLGMLQESLGQHEAARTSYEKAVAINKDFGPALNNLAALLADKYGDLDKALGLARRAYDRAMGDPVIADTLGWILFRQGQYISALPLLQSSVEKRPIAADAMYHLAMTQYYLGQEAAAAKTFERLLALRDNAQFVEDARARVAVLSIPVTEAAESQAEHLTAQLSKEPKDPAVLTRLGFIELKKGSAQKAAERFEAALKTNSQAVPAMVALAQLNFGELKNEKAARAWATKAHGAAPNDPQVQWQLGRMVYQAGDFAWAAALLQDAARSLKENGEVRFELARALYDSGRIEEAKPHLQGVIDGKDSPTVAAAAREMSELIDAVATPAKLTQARVKAQAILVDTPQSLPAQMVVAAAFEQEGKFNEARDTYTQMLRRSSGFTPATRRLALLYGEQLADDAKAEELALQARKVYSDDPDLAYVLASVSYRKADYANAVKYLRQALRKRDNHGLSHFLLGMSLYYLKNPPESQAALERAIELKLPPQESTEAERVLDELGRGRA